MGWEKNDCEEGYLFSVFVCGSQKKIPAARKKKKKVSRGEKKRKTNAEKKKDAVMNNGGGSAPDLRNRQIKWGPRSFETQKRKTVHKEKNPEEGDFRGGVLGATRLISCEGRFWG